MMSVGAISGSGGNNRLPDVLQESVRRHAQLDGVG